MRTNFNKFLPQLFAVITATLGCISDGMHYGWTSPILPLLNANDTPIAITKTDELWLENIYMAGILAGLGITAWIIILIGVKFSIIFGAFCHLIAWVLITTLWNLESLYVARFMAGIGGNVAFVSIPMYIAEISEKKMRGSFGTLVFTNALLGFLIIYSIGPYLSIRASSMVGAGFSVLQIVTFSFMPNSPYSYFLKGKRENALKSLQWLRSRKDVTEELNEIEKAVERQQTETGRFIDIFLVDSNRKAFIIICVLNFAQHFSSSSVVIMNVHTILSDAVSIVPSDKAGIVIGAVMLFSGLSSTITIDKFGRKFLLISSGILTTIALSILATYFYVKEIGYDITTVNWIPFAAVILYALGFKFGLGMVPIVLIGELFPTSVKAKGMTISDITYAVFGLLSVYFYMYLIEISYMYVPFVLFAICCFSATIFVFFYVPETNGKSLEEIQMILKGQYHNDVEK